METKGIAPKQSAPCCHGDDEWYCTPCLSPQGFVWLLTGGLVGLQTGRGRDPGVREGQLVWWLAETGEGGAERGL